MRIIVVLSCLLFFQSTHGMLSCCSDQEDHEDWVTSCDERDLESANTIQPGPQFQLQKSFQRLNYQMRTRDAIFKEKHKKDIWCLKKSIIVVSLFTTCALGLSIMNMFYHPLS